MNELTKNPERQELSTKTRQNGLTVFNDKVFHKYRTNIFETTLRSDMDYFIEQEPVHENGKGIATRVRIKDIHTHCLLKTVELPYVKTVALLYENRYRVIRKAESDKRLILLRSIRDEGLFFEVNMQSDDSDYIRHQLSHSGQNHEFYTGWSNVDYDGPVYYRDKVYYINTRNHSSNNHPGEIMLNWYHLNSKTIYTYYEEIFKHREKHNKVIKIEPKTGVLTAYCEGLRKITQIDTRNDTVVYGGRESTNSSDYFDIFHSDSQERLLFITRECGIVYYDFKNNRQLFTLQLKEIKEDIRGFDQREPRWFNQKVHQITLNTDDSFAAIVFSTNYNKFLIIYDIESKKIALQCDLIVHSAFPQYCKSKMLNLNFSKESIDKIGIAFKILYNTYPFYRICEHMGHMADSRNRESAYCVRDDNIKFFDTQKFTFHVEKIDIKFDKTPSLGFTEDGGIVLFIKAYEGSYSWNPEKVVLISYNILNNSQVDMLDITDRIKDQYSMELDFKYPAIKFQRKGRYYNNYDMATVDQSGRIHIIEDANSIVDISKGYISKKSADKRKLFIYTRDNIPVTAIVLKEKFYKAKFSNKEDCINIFYYGPDTMERYNIKAHAKGHRDPEVVTPLVDLYGYHFSHHLKESRDGRHLFHLYVTENTTRRLMIIDLEKNTILLDQSLEEHEIKALEMGIVDDENRFIILLGFYDVYFVNPFTLEILAKLYLYSRDRFLMVTYTDGKEGKYFYTNAPEMISVYEKDLNGNERLLEQGNIKRKQYLNIYNDVKKVREIVLNPDQFKADQQRLSRIAEIAKEGYGLLAEAEKKMLHE